MGIMYLSYLLVIIKSDDILGFSIFLALGTGFVENFLPAGEQGIYEWLYDWILIRRVYLRFPVGFVLL